MRLLLLLLLILPGTHFASTAYKENTLMLHKGSECLTNIRLVSERTVDRPTNQKMNYFQRWQLKIIHKKIAKKLQHQKGKTSKDIIANIALIAAVAGVGFLLLTPVTGFALLVTAIITGVLGVTNNDNPKSQKKALIGLIIGAAGTGLIIIAVIAFVSSSFHR